MLAEPSNIVTSLGYLGIFLLIFVFPVPQELILPLAGFMSAQGKFSLPYVVIAGVMGSTIGSLPWYYAGRYVGEARLQAWVKHRARWIKLSADDLHHAAKWFNRYGRRVILLSQFIPGMRTLIALPAGVNRMNLGLFLLYLILSAVLWQGALACTGYFLGAHYGLINQYLGPSSRLLVLVSLLVFVGCWLIKRSR